MNVPLSIGLHDYQQDFDPVTSEELGDLSKALEAGELQGGDMTSPNQTNGGPLKVESLESSLKILQFRESDIRLWKSFPKAPAYNTVEEFNQLTSYGDDRGGFNNEGELPEEEDSQYSRQAEKVKFLGVTKSITHPMELVTTNVGNLVQRETTNGILWILRKANKGLFYGDDKIVKQEFNGVYAQHMNNEQYSTLKDYLDSELVIDLRGKTLKESAINGACETLVGKFAQPDFLIAPPVVLSDFAENFYARQRMLIGASGNSNNNGVVGGAYIKGFQSQYGLINFEYDIFATKGTRKLGNATQTSPKAPAAPVYKGVEIVSNDTESKWADSVGDVKYAISAINRYGESSLTIVTDSVTVANPTDSVDLQFTAGFGPYAPNAFVIYRSHTGVKTDADKTEFYPIMVVPVAGNDVKRGSLQLGVDGSAPGKVRDRNRFLPATEEAYLTQHSTDVYEFKQLAPLMKMDLAILGPSRRFMVLLYGTPIVYAPSKIVRFINIGRKDRIQA